MFLKTGLGKLVCVLKSCPVGMIINFDACQKGFIYFLSVDNNVEERKITSN
jgi:hypothetical protein